MEKQGKDSTYRYILYSLCEILRLRITLEILYENRKELYLNPKFTCWQDGTTRCCNRE